MPASAPLRRRIRPFESTRVVATALAGWLAVAHAAGTPGSAHAEESPTRRLRFEVFLDERPIGEQVFELAGAADDLSVDTRARFELTLLGIKALDYVHRNRERWRAGCLDSIESETTQNGKPYRVRGRSGEDGFAVEGEKGRALLDGCIGTFSYWDKRALLARRRLLNSQTGEHLPVEIRAVGGDRLRIGARDVEVDRYEIRGKDLEIDLAYAREGGEWVALDSPLFMGRTLRYRRDARDLDR